MRKRTARGFLGMGRARTRAPYELFGLGNVIPQGSPLNRAESATRRKTNTWTFDILSTGSKQYLPETGRRYLKLINTGANPIRYSFGSPASTTSILLAAGAETEYTDSPSQASIHALAITADSSLMVLEEVG